MTKYMIIHCKHDGCYDFKMYEDPETKTRLTSIRINPPLVFLYDDKEKAQEFFSDYINNVDNIDNRCKKGDDVEHIDFCTCGIIELDEEGENPVLFYNKKNQIFFLEMGGQVFSPPHELKNDVSNFNITNKLLKKFRTLSKEQKEKYVELGKLCQECIEEDEKEDHKIKETETSETNEIISTSEIKEQEPKDLKVKKEPKDKNIEKKEPKDKKKPKDKKEPKEKKLKKNENQVKDEVKEVKDEVI